MNSNPYNKNGNEKMKLKKFLLFQKKVILLKKVSSELDSLTVSYEGKKGNFRELN